MPVEWVERVYLIGASNLATVKIGRSVDLVRRLYQIQLMSPVELEVLWCRVGGEKLERALHRRFDAYRSHGEWFTLPDDPVLMVDSAAESLAQEVSAAVELEARQSNVKSRTLEWDRTVPLQVDLAVTLYLKIRRVFGDQPFSCADAHKAFGGMYSSLYTRIGRLCEMGLAEPAGSEPGTHRASKRQRYVAHRLPRGTRLGPQVGVRDKSFDAADLLYALDHNPNQA
ncbi:GIY-YIG nuclease family protein [Streptomyces sp. NPDC004230]